MYQNNVCVYVCIAYIIYIYTYSYICTYLYVEEKTDELGLAFNYLALLTPEINFIWGRGSSH